MVFKSSQPPWPSLKAKAKASDSYIACLTGTKPNQPGYTIIGSGSWSARSNGAAALMRPSIARANKEFAAFIHCVSEKNVTLLFLW